MLHPPQPKDVRASQAIKRPTCWASSCARHTKQEDTSEFLLLSRSQKPESWLCFRIRTFGIVSIVDSKRLVWGIQPALLPVPQSIHSASAGFGHAWLSTPTELKLASPKAHCQTTRSDPL